MRNRVPDGRRWTSIKIVGWIIGFTDHYGVVTNGTFHGLFATKNQGWSRTLVITTTDDIIAIENSGQVRLLRLGDINMNGYKIR